MYVLFSFFLFFFQAEDGIRDTSVTGVQTCALPISRSRRSGARPSSQSGSRRSRSSSLCSTRGWHVRASAISSSSYGRRSEERRVGKECRSRWAPYELRKKEEKQELVRCVRTGRNVG